MKIKLLLLVGIGFAPFLLMAQSSFLYNKGLMSVKGSGLTNADDPTQNKTTLYINGDFIAGGGVNTGGNVTLCNVYLSGSQTVLTGDFIHDLNPTTKAYGDSYTSNVFNLVGDDNYEGQFSTYGSLLVFRGTKKQSIKMTTGLVYGRDYQPSYKGSNYINFPDIVVDNINHVNIVPELAAQAKNLRLVKGRFIIESRRAVTTDFNNVYTDGGLHNPNSSTMLAHFMITQPVYSYGTVGNITTPNNTTYASQSLPRDNFGAVQVDLAVDDPALATTNEKTGRSLIAMGSPYQEMKADYFFWNFLMIPKNESIIGGNTMTDPTYTLGAGKGFVLGVDLRGTNAANYTDIADAYKNKNILFTDRGGAGVSSDVSDKGKYYFSRFGPFFDRSTNIFQATGYTPTSLNLMGKVGVTTHAAYTKEVLNKGDITNLPISKGAYNYYANPYIVPLQMSAILSSGGGNNIWGSKFGNATVTDRDFVNKVWVLDSDSKGSGSYDIFNPTGIGPGNKWVMVNAKYRVMKSTGSTVVNSYAAAVDSYDSGTGSSTVLAPLQMFVLYSPASTGAATTFKIPAAAREIRENALFLRSTGVSTSNVLKDDFIFEITDETTKSTDRTAIVIRTPQEVMTNSEYEPTKKMLVLIASDQTTSNSTTEEGAVTQTYMSTVYTKDSKGMALESNVLGVPQSAETESVVLYVTPSLMSQNISINASRLGTADRVQGITLIDKVANKEFDLYSGKSYSTASKPTDPVDRFTVRFAFGTSGIEGGGGASESKNITSYYSNGVLTVAGFEDSDFGSLISVFDIQGRRVAQAKVDNTSVEIRQAFYTGAYIVKVVGTKSYAAKFLVK